MLPAMRILLDFVVWDNDGLYALVTSVAIIFAIVLIIVVTHNSHTPERERNAQERAAAAQLRRKQHMSAESTPPGPTDIPTPTMGA